MTRPLRMRVQLDDSPAWWADVDTYEHAGTHPVRWNGWLACPRFDRATAEKIVAHVSEGNEGGRIIEQDRFAWVDELLVRVRWDGEVIAPNQRPVFTAEVIAPDSQGRYTIGAYEWCWYEAWDENQPQEDGDGLQPEVLPLVRQP